MVIYAINGLKEYFGSLAQIIAHKDPFPTLATMRSMVTTEEMRLRSKLPTMSTNNTSSAPQALLVASQNRGQENSSNNRDRESRNTNKTEVWRYYGRDFCRWGAHCRYLHDSNRAGASTPNSRNNGSQNNTRSNNSPQNVQHGLGTGGLNLAGQQQLLALLQAQNQLLAQYGLQNTLGQSQVHAASLLGSRPNTFSTHITQTGSIQFQNK